MSLERAKCGESEKAGDFEKDECDNESQDGKVRKELNRPRTMREQPECHAHHEQQ